MADACTWCGEAVDDGFRLYESPGERRASFCRLEHVVPWALQGAHWEAGDERPSVPPIAHTPGRSVSCSQCGEELGEVQVLLVRHRGEHRVHDGFCGVDHLLEWAKAGGRWQ